MYDVFRRAYQSLKKMATTATWEIQRDLELTLLRLTCPYDFR
jgi:hypothetical protein